MVSSLTSESFKTEFVNLSNNIVNNYLVINSGGSIGYRVINGICFFRVNGVKFGTNATSITQKTTIVTGTPKVLMDVPFYAYLPSSNTSKYFVVEDSGLVIGSKADDTSSSMSFTIIYPVAGEWPPEWNT